MNPIIHNLKEPAMRNPRHFNHFHKSLFRLYCDMTQGFVTWDEKARYELEAVLLQDVEERDMISYYLNEALTMLQTAADKKQAAEEANWPSRTSFLVGGQTPNPEPITPLHADMLTDSQFDAPQTGRTEYTGPNPVTQTIPKDPSDAE